MSLDNEHLGGRLVPKVWRPDNNVGCPHLSFPAYFPELGSLTRPGTMLAIKMPTNFQSRFPRSERYRHIQPYLASYIELMSLILIKKN